MFEILLILVEKIFVHTKNVIQSTHMTLKLNYNFFIYYIFYGFLNVFILLKKYCRLQQSVNIEYSHLSNLTFMQCFRSSLRTVSSSEANINRHILLKLLLLVTLEQKVRFVLLLDHLKIWIVFNFRPVDFIFPLNHSLPAPLGNSPAVYPEGHSLVRHGLSLTVFENAEVLHLDS